MVVKKSQYVTHNSENEHVGHKPVRMILIPAFNDLLFYPLNKFIVHKLIYDVNRLEYHRAGLTVDGSYRSLLSQMTSAAPSVTQSRKNMFFGSRTLLPICLGNYSILKVL